MGPLGKASVEAGLRQLEAPELISTTPAPHPAHTHTHTLYDAPCTGIGGFWAIFYAQACNQPVGACPLIASATSFTMDTTAQVSS